MNMMKVGINQNRTIVAQQSSRRPYTLLLIELPIPVVKVSFIANIGGGN
jgi:hypothetical protein